jgi:hypothetical protein
MNLRILFPANWAEDLGTPFAASRNFTKIKSWLTEWLKSYTKFWAMVTNNGSDPKGGRGRLKAKSELPASELNT